MNEKVKYLNAHSVSTRTMCCVKSYFEVQSFGLEAGPQSFYCSFIALSIARSSKSAQKFTVGCVKSLMLWKPHSWF